MLLVASLKAFGRKNYSKFYLHHSEAYSIINHAFLQLSALFYFIFLALFLGGMAEWFKASVLKTDVSQDTGSSNLSPSANSLCELAEPIT